MLRLLSAPKLYLALLALSLCLPQIAQAQTDLPVVAPPEMEPFVYQYSFTATQPGFEDVHFEQTIIESGWSDQELERVGAYIENIYQEAAGTVPIDFTTYITGVEGIAHPVLSLVNQEFAEQEVQPIAEGFPDWVVESTDRYDQIPPQIARVLSEHADVEIQVSMPKKDHSGFDELEGIDEPARQPVALRLVITRVAISAAAVYISVAMTVGPDSNQYFIAAGTLIALGVEAGFMIHTERYKNYLISLSSPMQLGVRLAIAATTVAVTTGFYAYGDLVFWDTPRYIANILVSTLATHPIWKVYLSKEKIPAVLTSHKMPFMIGTIASVAGVLNLIPALVFEMAGAPIDIRGGDILFGVIGAGGVLGWIGVSVIGWDVVTEWAQAANAKTKAALIGTIGEKNCQRLYNLSVSAKKVLRNMIPWGK